MDRSLESILYHQYPEIFSPNTWHFWFECGDGWFELINTLCRQIQNYIENKKVHDVIVEQVIALQVKEKYGGMCFYYTGGDEVIDQMILLASAISYKTCEKCGCPASVQSSPHGWVTTYCEKCRNKLNESPSSIRSTS